MQKTNQTVPLSLLMAATTLMAPQAMAQQAGNGQLTVGVSHSTLYGSTADISLSGEDIAGSGVDVDLEHRLGDEGQGSRASITKTWDLGQSALGADSWAAIEVNGALSDWDIRPYSESHIGLELQFGAALGQNLSWQGSLFWQRDELDDLDSGISPIIAADSGESEVAGLTLGLHWDSARGRELLQPGTSAALGGKLSVAQQGRRDSRHLYASFETTQALAGRTVWRLSASGGAVRGTGDEGYVHILDRAFLGGKAPRGFASGSAGPRDTSTGDALGGTKYLTGSVEVLTPGWREDVALGVFYDFGSTWDLPGISGVDDSRHWRSSVGLSGHWQSRYGDLSLSWAAPINSQDIDEEQRLSLSLNARF